MRNIHQNDSKDSRKSKATLHPKNKHKGSYDFKELSKVHPLLKKFVRPTKYGIESIEFSNHEAVKALNTALLKYYYKIEFWDIPKNYLCPPIPGRADYIHHVAQLLGSKNSYKIPMNGKVTCLDIGTGANCIYPIIGHQEYGWKFIGTDIDEIALNSAQEIVNLNNNLTGKVELRLQQKSKHIFKGIIQSKDQIDLVICNPPFHSSEKEANISALRKVRNLKTSKKVQLNFGGTNKELWCEGGEKQFIKTMINESKIFGKSCYWFSTLVSKKENLKGIYRKLKNEGAYQIKTINMGQGNKLSRIVAWTFLNNDEQEEWMHNKWRAWSKDIETE
jgi:23S rRNA (adenine1618-N6)-methyltransferase